MPCSQKFLLAAAVSIAGALAPALHAQTALATVPVPQNVVQLTASGAIEVPQDLMTITLTTTREGSDAATVQSQLKVALDAALAEARKAAQPGQLDVHTGSFSLYPRYTKEGKISTWQGSGELVLEGKDFARISTTAGRIPSLTVGSVAFALSREQRTKVEAEAQAMAIERFKAKASDIARGFGFGSYSLREISVSADEGGGIPRPRMMAAQAKSFSAADTPVPVEAGKSTVDGYGVGRGAAEIEAAARRATTRSRSLS